MSKYAIQVKNLGKEYIIGGAEQRHDSFREMLTSSMTAPLRKLRKLGGAASDEERFWALRDVNFKVEQGEVLGIIGRNGAGKSTLLKVLSRITSPTTGRVVIRGRMASLLEVGTGFHPELTGRENIFLNGAILGMSRKDIQRCFDEIVAFAEIEKFLDTPVKRYSSGMYVRLAFSVAAHLDTDTLMVDEVLAVGDQEFQNRCMGKMSTIAATGRTVLFVSHNINAIQSLCSRSILLVDGFVVLDDVVDVVTKHYLSTWAPLQKQGENLVLNGPLANTVQIQSVLIENGSDPSLPITFINPIRIRVKGICDSPMADLEVAVGVSSKGLRLCSLHDSSTRSAMKSGEFESVFCIGERQLRPGNYSLSVGANQRGKSMWCWAENVTSFLIENAYLNHEAERDLGIVSVVYSGKRIQS